MSRFCLVLCALVLCASLVDPAAAATQLRLFSSSSTSDAHPGEHVAITLSIYADAPAPEGVFVSMNPDFLAMSEGLRYVSWRSSDNQGWEGATWAGVVASGQPITLELMLEIAPDAPTSSRPFDLCYVANSDPTNHVQSCVTLRVDQLAPAPRPSTNVFMPLVRR